MTSRRRFLTLLGASTTFFTGCISSSTDSVNETPSPEEVKPTETPAPTATPTPENQDLTGEQVYQDWIHGGIYENEQENEILEKAQQQISFNQINQALEQGNNKTEKIANAIIQANQQITQNTDYETKHRTALSAVHQTLNQNQTKWNITIHSIADWAKTTAYPSEGLDYSKVWIEGEDQDINLALNPESRNPTYHIENTKANSDVQKILKDLRDPETPGHLTPHDYEGIQNQNDILAPSGGYSDEQIEEINGSFMEEFSNYILGDGRADPNSIDDWRALHEGFESGADALLSLNEAYHNSEYSDDGETALFDAQGEEELDGSVTMEDTPDGYDASENGIAGNPAA
jgi:hypothetical protein